MKAEPQVPSSWFGHEPSALCTSVQVSHEQCCLCLTLADVVGPSRRLCLMLLNFSSCAMVTTSGVAGYSLWSLMLGP